MNRRSALIHLFKHLFIHKTFTNTAMGWAQWGFCHEIESWVPRLGDVYLSGKVCARQTLRDGDSISKTPALKEVQAKPQAIKQEGVEVDIGDKAL